MNTIRRFIYREVIISVGFVTLAFLALFFFFDLVDELRWVGRLGANYQLTHALLFVALSLRGGPGESLQTTAQTLLSHLSLLFVPAGVGIIVHLSRVADEWPALLAALLVSTFVSMAVTALVMKALAHKPAEPGSAS